jgi:predicted Fe-Mo cluster-binding NifX family protein
MKVAVSSTGSQADSQVDPRFGRARWFLIWDTDSEDVSAIDNLSSVEASSGAGIAAAQRVIDAGASCVLTGRCGPKASTVLGGAGVRIVDGISGSAAAAIDAFRKGQL